MKWVMGDVGATRLSWSPLAVVLWTIVFAEIGLLVSIAADFAGDSLCKIDPVYLMNDNVWSRTPARLIEYCAPYRWEGCFLPLVGGILRSRGRLAPTLAILGGGLVGFVSFLPTLTGTHTGRTWTLMEKAIPGTLFMTLAVVAAVLVAAAYSKERQSRATD